MSHRRWTGTVWERVDYFLPACSGCTYVNNNNLGTPTSTLESNLVTEYENSVTSAGVTIGIRP